VKIEINESLEKKAILASAMPINSIGKLVDGRYDFHILRSTTAEIIRIWPSTGEFQSMAVSAIPKDWKVTLLP
jgi:hypothetical protein